MKKLWWILAGILREIGDENAYARHLTRLGVPPSRAEWHRFQERRLGEKYKKPKCC